MKCKICKWKLIKDNKLRCQFTWNVGNKVWTWKCIIDLVVNYEWMLLFDVHWLLDVNVIDYIRFNKIMELNKWKEKLSN